MNAVMRFKEAFSRYPSGVVIVTARGVGGEAMGFTASSFTSVSADPPLVLACLNRAAACYPTFESAETFAVSILRADQKDLAERFAQKGVDKFVPGAFLEVGRQPPVVKDALAALICRKTAQYPGGDHGIIVGEVISNVLGDPGSGMVHYLRRFWEVGERSA